MSFRKEKKFRLTTYQALKIMSGLRVAGLEQLYPRRRVNSIYLDTKDLQMFSDSEEGLLPRKKVRLRWYDDDINVSKEVKISTLEGRFKTTAEASNFKDHGDLLNTHFHERDYGLLKPTLKVSYSRDYYLIKGIRVTLDKDIRYENLTSDLKISVMDIEQVMELKIPSYVSDDYVECILPNPTTRFSKYCRGIIKSYEKKANF